MVTWFALIQTEFSNVRADLQAFPGQGKVQSKELDDKMKFIQYYQFYIIGGVIIAIFGVSYLLLEILLLLTPYCTL